LNVATPSQEQHVRVTFATVLTMLRILLVPLFGMLWATGRLRGALALFLLAALTDVADGFVARYFHQKSELGAMLDPAADKLMLLVSYLVAAQAGVVPVWLAGLVIGRDAAILFCAGLFKLALPGRYDPEQWRPTRIGKYATFSHTFVVALALITQVTRAAGLAPWFVVTMAGAAVLTVISTAQYFASGFFALVRSQPSGGRHV
jgi:cardiolipin synthase